MANTFTPTYNLTKPEIGSDTNAWGAHLNGNFDTIDSNMVSRTLTSAQTLAGAINLPSNGLNVGSGQLRVNGGNVSASGALAVSGATTLYTTLTVSSTANLQGAVNVTGATALSSTLSVAGATTLAYNGLNVGSGQLNCTGGNVAMSGSLTVTGSVTSGSASIGSLAISGAITGGSLNIASGQLSVSGGNVSASGSISASGNLSASGTLYAGGTTTLAGALNVSGLASFAANNFNVGSGQLYVSGGNVGVANGIYIGGVMSSGSVSTGSVGCAGVTCTTINTQGNTITAGAINCGAISSTSINTNGNAVTSGSLSTGAVTVSSTSPTITMADTNYGTFSVYCNDGSIGFLNTSSGWACRVDNSNNLFVGGSLNSGSLSTGGITCTTINTQGNTISAGSVNCGAISSGAINTNGNALTSGSISTGSISASGNVDVSGYIRINNAANFLYLNDTNYGQFSLHCNDGNVGFVGTGGSWISRTDNSGNFTATGDVTAYSDERLKENVHTIRDAVALVSRMRGVFYDRVDTGKAGVGVIAQEMQEILPQVVHQNDGTLSVAYGNIVGVLIEAVKELNERVAAVEAR
jgi:hypothetical protein